MIVNTKKCFKVVSNQLISLTSRECTSSKQSKVMTGVSNQLISLTSRERRDKTMTTTTATTASFQSMNFPNE